MPFRDSVTTECDWADLNSQVRNKVNEIAQDAEGGRNTALGDVQLANRTRCYHWRAGSYRIFGTVTNGEFTFLGWGQHAGGGNNNYTVNLCSGRRTSATTT